VKSKTKWIASLRAAGETYGVFVNKPGRTFVDDSGNVQAATITCFARHAQTYSTRANALRAARRALRRNPIAHRFPYAFAR
jgi:hypothetical protein